MRTNDKWPCMYVYICCKVGHRVELGDETLAVEQGQVMYKTKVVAEEWEGLDGAQKFIRGGLPGHRGYYFLQHVPQVNLMLQITCVEPAEEL